jgi:uncharacterized protein
MTTEVRNAPDRGRYELHVEGELAGVAEYRLEAGGVAVFPHTEIVPHLRGRGLGAVLVRAALDDVRATGRRVVPHCWYVARYIDEHPAYTDLVAG